MLSKGRITVLRDSAPFQRTIVAGALTILLGLPFLASHSLAEEAGYRPFHPKAPAAVMDRLTAGTPQDVIVLFDDSAVADEAKTMRRDRGLVHDDNAVLELKGRRYRDIRQRVLNALPSGEFEIKREYSHLPMAFLKVRTKAAMDRLLDRPDVLAVYENRKIYHQLTQSLPLVDQPEAASVGYKGEGITVAVIDTGVNYTNSAFGSCTSPGVPSGCRVVASVDLAENDGVLDSSGHGTNVSGIIAGTASKTKIAAVDVFESDGSSTYDLLVAGINWAIDNRSAYNISVINMSLGDGLKNTSACGSYITNAFMTPIANARSAGIIPVAASGNEAYSDGMAKPACTPGVVSVGAVYDSNMGQLAWSTCTDSSTAADQIVCFSNSANFLTMLAPGAKITAAGYISSGTSQASPHVAGAVAALRAAFPSETLDQTVSRLTGNGTQITDPRNGVTKPRLNLLAAIGAPGNDLFAAAPLLVGNNGVVTGSNYNATKETGEPNHAGNTGGKSVWWKWSASFTGVATFDTHGSGFDTLLGVYTGTGVSSLNQVAANNNDGSGGGTSGVTFTAVAGTEYRIAVDGYGGASGPVTLNWNLAPQADLSLSAGDSPDPLAAGDDLTYTLTTLNLGPSTATGVTLTDILPANTLFVSASDGCSQSGDTVTCAQGSLAAGNSAAVTIVVRPQAAGTLNNSASVSSDASDPVSGNNAAATDTTVTAAPPVAVPAHSQWGLLFVVALLGLYMARKPGNVT
ncbi:MAG TPA: S8 family serine peptidase [Geobacteraceae bacterium]|nr:S8 family serine peptidase [Geobacteraceae bacterium]